GYTVKVLDFGIAKLEEVAARDTDQPETAFSQPPGDGLRRTIVSGDADYTIVGDRPITFAGEGATVVQAHDNGTAAADAATIAESNPAFTESRTAIMSPPLHEADEENSGTRLISQAGATDRSQKRVL